MSDDLYHGGALDRVAVRFPRATQPWVDLSTGINPCPYPTEAMSTDSLCRLPTRQDMDRCGCAMAGAFAAPRQALTLVPGSEVAIRLLPHLISATRVAVLDPTYSDHTDTWRAAGAQIELTADPLSYADRADVIALCNPNNPDGKRFTTNELAEAHASLAHRGGWLIVDEAYADLTPDLSLAPLAGAQGLVILRSAGKFFGLPGLRLGAVLGPPAITEGIERMLGLWRVSTIALNLGATAYADSQWQQTTRDKLATNRRQFDESLLSGGLQVVGGTDLFRYVAVPDAHSVWHRLCEQGIYTRRFNWTRSHLRMGLPNSPEAEARLLSALSA